MPNYTFFFENKQYLNYNKNYDLLKTSENYRILNSDMAQQILKEVDKNFKLFFSLLKLAQKGECDYKAYKLPHYLPKDGFTALIIGMVRIKGNKLILPYSNLYRKSHAPIEITLPPTLLNKNNALAIDPGVSNLVTAVTTLGKSFIVVD